MRGKAIEESQGKDPSISKGFEAIGMVTSMMADMRAKWLDELDQRRMSPKEFHAITAALYTSTWQTAARGAQQSARIALEQMKTQLEAQASNPELPEEARARAREGIADAERQLAAMSEGVNEELDALHAANAALAKKFEAQIKEHANPVLDGLLLGDDGSNLGAAFEDTGAFDQPAE